MLQSYEPSLHQRPSVCPQLALVYLLFWLPATFIFFVLCPVFLSCAPLPSPSLVPPLLYTLVVSGPITQVLTLVRASFLAQHIN